ncbi:(2Fe-2S)-binding protein [Paralimibaculum aggregatum]|uniref:(2Fe-2S)-binding protein n=1 Tax=Paralimibaculum aggregatum TaxID=3036245 RepID=A0ABQ6LSZ4_9RHOB|nr:(2Fe-2S)-binding protein [Limibaculum sp. NKW23]GMG85189.1 (2Fe-2S)-binding protein [Limibaculum sp. NKW23]
MKKTAINLTVNGRSRDAVVPPRMLLSDLIRHELALPGTHVGCEHGVCGACNVLVDGKAVRSCLMFAVQADGCEITTVEGFSAGGLDLVQTAFWEEHGLQCGFCTPGMLASAHELLAENPDPTDDEIREAIAGNLCRCTGYEYIIAAIRSAARKMRDAETAAKRQPA